MATSNDSGKKLVIPAYARRWFIAQDRLVRECPWQDYIQMIESDQRADDLMCVLRDALTVIAHGGSEDVQPDVLANEALASIVLLYALGHKRGRKEAMLQTLYKTEGE